MMNTASPRTFIVGPSGDDAVIREIANGETHLSRERAWERALRRAWPVKGRKGVGSVIFIGLDGSHREIASPGEVQAHWLANRLNDPQPTRDVAADTEAAGGTMPDGPAPERISAVVAALRAQNPNEFRDSLLDQYDRKGRLSLKQVEAVERGIAKRAAPQPTISVPAGRYAVENDDGKLAFYVVDYGREGTRWEGYTFVSVMASDEEHRIRGAAARDAILAKIAVDPKAASARYGHELGVCGVCNRTLTDEASRAAGIGPVCAGKAGW